MAHEPVSPEINKLCGALNLHDLNQSITKEQLADISQVLRLSSDELDIIFDALDHDNKGHITLEDLKFEIADNKSSTPTKRRISQGHTHWTDNRAYINLSPEDLDVGVFSETRWVERSCWAFSVSKPSVTDSTTLLGRWLSLWYMFYCAAYYKVSRVMYFRDMFWRYIFIITNW